MNIRTEASTVWSSLSGRSSNLNDVRQYCWASGIGINCIKVYGIIMQNNNNTQCTSENIKLISGASLSEKLSHSQAYALSLY